MSAETNDNARKQRVQRMVADKVTDEMLSTPVGELTDVQVAILRAALNGPHAQEIIDRMDARNAERKQVTPQ